MDKEKNDQKTKRVESKESLPQAKEPFKFAGYVGQVGESIMVALTLLCLKLLPVENSIQEKAKASMLRGLFMTIFCGASILCQGQSFKIARGEHLIIFFRSFLGGFNTFLAFLAVKYISMGESVAIIYSSSVWTCILSFVVLREPLQISLLLALPVSFLGIILLAQPDLIVDPTSELATVGILLNNTAISHNASLLLPGVIKESLTMEEAALEAAEEAFFEQRWPGIAISLANSLVLSVVIIILKLRKGTPIATCSFYLGLAMFLFCLGLQFIIGFGALPASLLECTLHLCIGLLSYAGQCLFQWSLIYVPAGTYSIISSLKIVLGFIFGALFLHELILWTSVLGSALIMVVVAILILNDQIVRRLKMLFARERLKITTGDAGNKPGDTTTNVSGITSNYETFR